MSLYLPKITATPQEVADSPNSLKAMRQWCEKLSIVNAGETARQIFSTLQVLNRQSIDAPTRLQLMETLRPHSRDILNYLYKQLANMPLPMTTRNQKIDQLIHALLRELAIGYKWVAYDISEQQGKTALKPLGLACHRALRLLGEAMVQSDRTYSVVQDKLWHDSHRIFSTAEKFKVHQQAVTDKDYRTIERSSCVETYKQMSVLYLCQPFRLRQSESDALRRFLESAISMIDMKKSLEADDRGAVFVTSLRSSVGPAYVPLAEITTFSNLRGFGFERLFQYLKQRRADLPDDSGQTAPLTPTLAARVLHILTSQEKRRYSRVNTHRTATVAMGLQNIIDALRADTQPELSREELFGNGDQQPKPESSETLAGLELDRTSLYQDFFASSLDETLAPKQAPASWQLWQVSNSGAAGYGLSWTSNEPCLAAVGELIAVREKEYNLYHWRIGVIRWIRNNQPDSIDLGVEVLAPRTLLVKAPPPLGGEPQDALMLPGMKAVEQAPSMIVSSHIFSVGDRLDVQMLEKTLSIELKSVGENPGVYTQFFYSARQLAQTPVKTDSFDDLWSKL